MSGIISARAWGKVWAYRSTFLLGLLNTVETAIFAILLALVLGVIFGLMATSGKKILQVISRVYVEIMQNTPILLQLCFFYYALAFSGHSIGILPTGIVALGVYTGAYMAEVVRAGIEAVPKGQFEAAMSHHTVRTRTRFFMKKGLGTFFVYRKFCGRTTRNGKRAKAGYHYDSGILPFALRNQVCFVRTWSPPYMAHWGQSLHTCVPGRACTPLARCNTLDFVPKSVC